MPMILVLMMKSQMPGMVGMGTNPGDIIYRWVATTQKHPTVHAISYFPNNSKAKCHLSQRLCMPERKRSQIHKAVKKTTVSCDAGSNRPWTNNKNKVIKVKQFKA